MKSGLIGGTVFFVLLYLVNVFVGMEVPDDTKIWASFSSHTAMSYSSDSFIIAEVIQIIVYLLLFNFFASKVSKRRDPNGNNPG
jgi:hypothetical protein